MDAPIIVLIDGECVMCNRLAKFVIRRDPNWRFRFAALGSSAAARVLADRHLPPPPPGTFVLIDGGRALIRSDAALRLVRELPPPWPWLGVLRMIPRPLRDAGYSLVAAIRYRILGRVESCSLLGPDERQRFIPDGDPAGCSES